MTEPVQIGIIGGGGWMGLALAKAMVAAGILPENRLLLSYRSHRPDALAGAGWVQDNQYLVERSDILIVAVRPADFAAIDVVTRDKLVVSVMAGISLERLSRHFRTQRVVRTLPNAAAEVRKSYTPWVASSGVTAADRAMLDKILQACGTADAVSTEADIDYLTGLTGSGPAFPVLLAAAMMEDAIRHGLPPDIARRSVNAVLVGTGHLIEGQGDDPREVVRRFIEYRGTTAAALEAMQAGGFETAVRDGLAAALQKARSMRDSG